jgi:tRNA(Arg) A34 adenosine deaminase TadA
MAAALDAAAAAAARGEVPVGAALVDPAGRIAVTSGNEVEARADPTAHAELLALRAPGLRRLDGWDLYVTLEPCALCAAAISLFRIRRLYFGAYDPKGGAVEHGPRLFDQPTCLHRPDRYGGIREREAGLLLSRFFQGLRST